MLCLPVSLLNILPHRATTLTRVDLKIFQRHWAGCLANVLQDLLVQSCREAAHALGFSLSCEEICRKTQRHSNRNRKYLQRKSNQKKKKIFHKKVNIISFTKVVFVLELLECITLYRCSCHCIYRLCNQVSPKCRDNCCFYLARGSLASVGCLRSFHPWSWCMLPHISCHIWQLLPATTFDNVCWELREIVHMIWYKVSLI